MILAEQPTPTAASPTPRSPLTRKKPRAQTRQVSRAALVFVCSLPVVLIAVGLPPPARAIDSNSGALAEECAWSSVVRVGAEQPCTGVYLGSRRFLTAAHCVNEDGPTSLSFGEDDMFPAVQVFDFLGCEFRTNWEPDTTFGPDIAICTIGANEDLPNIPIVPPMIPTGCARDHLAHEIYVTHGCEGVVKNSLTCAGGPDTVAIGMGCESAGNCNMSGNKRAVTGMLIQQVTHPGASDGSFTKLEFNEHENSQGPVAGEGVLSGDSGGPLMWRMRDGSWRLIGLASRGNNASSEKFEAVPPYLHWLESTTLADFSPCHARVNGEWVWTGDCADSYPVDIEFGYDEWTYECADPMWGGGIDECATGYYNGDFDSPNPPLKTPLGLLVPLSTLDSAYPKILAMAADGGFGRPADAAAIRRAFLAASEPLGIHAFLATQTPEGHVELELAASEYTRRVMGAL